MGSKMQVDAKALKQLARCLLEERKRQGLTREQAAAVCNVSTSFIRDAESDPASCSLGRLLQLTEGLGLKMTLSNWQTDAKHWQITESEQTKTRVK